MWELYTLRIPWASTACYRDSFTFFYKREVEKSVAFLFGTCSTKGHASVPGIVWFRWRGWDYTLKRAVMMIKPKGTISTTA
jgi:hypothetical protein